MKKLLKLLFITLCIITLSGCLNKDSMEDITVYTSIYPIEYVTEKLYGEHSNIISMYPNDTNPYDYKLTKKQVKDFGQGNLIVYNGLGREKDYIVDMINSNKNLKIIDSTARIEYTNSMDEIWINPSNILTIAQNIRNGLKEYITSSYLQKEIDENYNNLKLQISTIDAEMKEMVQNANSKAIIISDNDFKFLEKYGFEIISIDKNTASDKDLSDAKKLIANKTVSYIFAKKGNASTDNINDILKSYPTTTVLELDTLNTISNSDKSDNKDYISIMYENIDLLKKELY